MTSEPQKETTLTSRRARRAGWILVLFSLCWLLLPMQGASAGTSSKAQAGSHAAAKKSTAKKRTVARKKRIVVKRRGAASKRVVVKKHRVTRRHALARSHRKRAAQVAVRPLSFAMRAGLHEVRDDLDLKASVAYVIDQETDRVLLRKNDNAILPIASLTKLMTGVIIADAQLPMDEKITIAADDVDRLKNSSSRLPVGTVLTRQQALHLALMSSENRAAHALARTYPGGESAFVSAMNVKARQLGMDDTRYVEPTGLSSDNQSTARDLAVLAEAAYRRPLLRKYTTSTGYELAVRGGRTLHYNNTNRLVRDPDWDIGLQKTGFITEAGQCLLIQTKMAGRKLIMVFLDSASTIARIRDAERVRAWLEKQPDLAHTPREEDLEPAS